MTYFDETDWYRLLAFAIMSSDFVHSFGYVFQD